MSMPAPPDPTIERHRQRLEESLAKLRRALQHWQILSAEYEAFREELQALPDGAGREDMLAVGIDFGGTLVDEDEIKAFLGDKIGKRRTLGQVLATVGHRIDYVQENVTKVEKQLEKGETKLASLLVVAGPDLVNEEGLPIMDILEELDDDGNVVAATINGNDPTAPAQPIDTEGLEKFVDIAQEPEAPPAPAKAPPPQENKPKKPSPLRKVTSPDTAPAPARSLTNAEMYACEPPDVKLISSREEDGGGRVRVVDDAPEVAEQDWVQAVPGESAEDAAMRREMLKYNMQEIGAVVAEINLDEEGEYYGYEDSDYDDDEDDEDEEDEDEDGYGRATYKVITPELQKEMEELQRRVAARAEAARNGTKIPEVPEEQEEEEEEEEEEPKSGKKGVRFAKELDIAPMPSQTSARPGPAALPPFPTPPSAANQEDAIPLLLDLLAMDEMRKEELKKGELRKAGIKIAGEAPKAQKPSIFKAEKNAAPEKPAPPPSLQERVVPESIVASSVMERPPGLAAPSTPTEAPKARKPSRFMAAKAAGAGAPGSIFQNTTPTINPPEAAEDDDGDGDGEKPGQQPTVSDFIKEREPDANSAVEAPDELDPTLHRQEVATEFHRMRTRMIQQQGGFAETAEEGATVPLDQDGEKRKVSRFKAARMKAVGQ